VVVVVVVVIAVVAVVVFCSSILISSLDIFKYGVSQKTNRF